MSEEKQIEKEIEEMAHSLRIRKLDNEKIGFDVLSRLAGMAYKDEENSIARHIVTQLGYRKMPDNIGDFSDGYHTFNELYHHRAVLFSVICNMLSEKAWKSKLHDTGDMYDGMFIVGIETEQGQATYHYDIEPYWDMFKVKELEKAPKYDGHTPSDAIARIGNLPCEGYRKQSEWISVDERLPETTENVLGLQLQDHYKLPKYEQHQRTDWYKSAKRALTEKQKELAELKALRKQYDQQRHRYEYQKFKELTREYVGEIKFQELIKQVESELEAYTISDLMRHEYTCSGSKSSVTSINKL